MLNLQTSKVTIQSTLLLFFFATTIINGAEKCDREFVIEEHKDGLHWARTEQQPSINPLDGTIFFPIALYRHINLLKVVSLPKTVTSMEWSKSYYYALKVTLEDGHKQIINAYDL